MKILSVVGARPQFVKLAPMAEQIAAAGHEHVIVHTGQHYDAKMSDVFFDDLRIPAPDELLEVGSASHGVQTGRMLELLDPVLERHAPEVVLVYGDTNSTLAGALSAVKMHIRVAHLEAGLRSFNRAMPEEHNRVLVDHASDLLLAPTAVAMSHLANEGLSDRARLVGDVMTDVCIRVAASVQNNPIDLPVHVEHGGYVLATIHRAENTDDPQRLQAILAGLAALPIPVVLTAHPRLLAKAKALGLTVESGNIMVIEPLPYPAMVSAVANSAGVVTDSGGLQKEAYLLGVPCTTVRTETEWVETIAEGWNVLDPHAESLADLAIRPIAVAGPRLAYGDGHAAAAAVAEIGALH